MQSANASIVTDITQRIERIHASGMAFAKKMRDMRAGGVQDDPRHTAALKVIADMPLPQGRPPELFLRAQRIARAALSPPESPNV